MKRPAVVGSLGRKAPLVGIGAGFSRSLLDNAEGQIERGGATCC